MGQKPDWADAAAAATWAEHKAAIVDELKDVKDTVGTLADLAKKETDPLRKRLYALQAADGDAQLKEALRHAQSIGFATQVDDAALSGLAAASAPGRGVDVTTLLDSQTKVLRQSLMDVEGPLNSKLMTINDALKAVAARTSKVPPSVARVERVVSNILSSVVHLHAKQKELGAPPDGAAALKKLRAEFARRFTSQDEQLGAVLHELKARERVELKELDGKVGQVLDNHAKSRELMRQLTDAMGKVGDLVAGAEASTNERADRVEAKVDALARAKRPERPSGEELQRLKAVQKTLVDIRRAVRRHESSDAKLDEIYREVVAIGARPAEKAKPRPPPKSDGPVLRALEQQVRECKKAIDALAKQEPKTVKERVVVMSDQIRNGTSHFDGRLAVVERKLKAVDEEARAKKKAAPKMAPSTITKSNTAHLDHRLHEIQKVVNETGEDVRAIKKRQKLKLPKNDSAEVLKRVEATRAALADARAEAARAEAARKQAVADAEERSPDRES